MNSHKKIFYILFLLCISYCIEEDYIEINSMKKKEFNVNENQKAYFKYKLGDEKGPIGLHFHIANLYTVQVSIYKNIDEEAITSYLLAENQFKEINTKDFDEYVYILIEETYKYFYKDYITIYDPNKIIELKAEEPLIINNFLSNNKYEISFSSIEHITLLYNTNNTENNKRIITIKYENETIIDKNEESQYKLPLPPGNIYIIVENSQDTEDEENIMKQDFALIVYEMKNEYGFNEVIQNEIKKTKYIFNNEKQEFYYYVDITNNNNSNTLNFKLNFKYYILQNIQFFSDIIYLDEKISDSDLIKNIPKENKLPFSYDEDSDEFLRIYFKDEQNNKNYKYLLVKVEIEENDYYIGSKDIEVSLGNQTEIIKLDKIKYNEANTIKKKLADYIPIYIKLILDPNEIYLLTSQYEDLALFIKGDLLNDKNEINNNYLDSTNEIIILRDINELTIKIFGSTTKDLEYHIEKKDEQKLIFTENKRNNEIFQITENNCKSGETIYILGTYDYESYAYGDLAINYYATIDSGDFDVYYTNNISINDKSLFPLENDKKKNFYEIIPLNNNIDLFTIKCKETGSMSIRPEYKIFDENTHLIEQNSLNQIKLFDHSEIIQLTTSLEKSTEIVYFSILSLDGETINISPDTKGLFNNTIIKDNELFSGSANLSQYKMDQLAIRVNCSTLEKNIEVIEIIHNKYNNYKEIKKGENKNITDYNIFIKISNKISSVDIEFENLKNINISYGIIQSSSNDSNYLLTANNYPNMTNMTDYEIQNNAYKINIVNNFTESKNEKKPYLYCLVSILDQNDLNLNYNAKVETYEGNNKDMDETTVLIVFIVLLSSIILGFVILAIYLIVVKRKTGDINIDDKEEKLFSQNMKSEVDP